MGGHIVRAFSSMGKKGIALGNKPSEPRFEVTASGGVRVFLDDEARGSVLDENGAEPFVDPGGTNDTFDIGGDIDEALAARLDR